MVKRAFGTELFDGVECEVCGTIDGWQFIEVDHGVVWCECGNCGHEECKVIPKTPDELVRL